MRTLLRIDASSRVQGSHSRELADYVQTKWNTRGGRVFYRDLVEEVIPHIHNDTIMGFYSSPEAMTPENVKATALSDVLIGEIKNADDLLISSPLYNLNIPSNLKAYIDQITRIGQTFEMKPDDTFRGLLQGKYAHLVLVKGGDYANTPLESLDFQTPYLKTILEYLGIEVKNVFSLEGTVNKDKLPVNLRVVKNQVDAAFQQLSVHLEHLENGLSA